MAADSLWALFEEGPDGCGLWPSLFSGRAQLSQSLLGKRPARSGLQILFKSEGLFFFGECNLGLQLPRGVLGRVRYLACVVFFQTLAQVVCHSHVEMLWRFEASQDVHVSHKGNREGWLAEP